ncbi:hypothetical protein U472_08250 [Orenia metallireducens]|uniref:Teneurin-like YD-shell domain-containing protein n=1 Tax=Orenia metallireducens TaxID=1413210 RepID=A0A1C0A717_9FIRM|nr:RHS repeat-associated core domain-containing protein [Orenia metallireducens]OCL26008.1 hypothetical protein U472_08250 [Orenia metallireducens]
MIYEAGISTPTEYRYDPNGNLVKKIMSNGLVTEYEYNSLNQQIKEIKAGNQVTVYNYDGAGKLKTKINPLGIKEEYLYYLNGQLEEVNYYQNQEDEVANESVSYEYDDAGNRVLVEKEDSSIEQVYDQLGRIVSESRSISGKVYSTEYKYDKYGNLIGIKYPESDEYLNYGYDSLNQLKYITGIAGDKDNPAFSYNDNGQVTAMKYDNGVTTSYTYTDVGRPDTIITNRTDIETTTTEELLSLDYEYDGAGNVTRRNNNVYEYDGLNRLVSAQVEGDFYVDNPGDVGHILSDYYGSKGIDVLVNQIEDITLDYDSGSVGVSFGSEVEKISKIELKTTGMANHRISKRTLDIYYSSDNSSYTKLNPDSWEYQQDYKGDITIIIPDRITAKYLKIHSKYDDRNIDFDPVNKGEFTNILKNYIKVYRRETEATLVYDYDDVGNRLSKKLIAGTVEETNYFYYEGTNRLMSNGEYAYVYDEAGNLIKKGNNYSIEDGEVTFTETSGEKIEYWEYEYNLQNRLSKVYKNEELIAEFTYDGDNKRIKIIEHTHDGSVKETNFVHSASGKVIFEDESGDYTSYIFALNKQYAKVNGIVGVSTEITYFHQDNLGSTRVMTDASGKVVMNQDYLPFGGDLTRPNQIEIQNDSGESYKYTGQKQVVSTGLYYYGARYYDPSIGRFITEDSYRGELDNPQSQNVYIYVTQNPLKYVDPTGNTGILAQFITSVGPFATPQSKEAHDEAANALWRGAQKLREAQKQLVSTLVVSNVRAFSFVKNLFTRDTPKVEPEVLEPTENSEPNILPFPTTTGSKNIFNPFPANHDVDMSTPGMEPAPESLTGPNVEGMPYNERSTDDNLMLSKQGAFDGDIFARPDYNLPPNSYIWPSEKAARRAAFRHASIGKHGKIDKFELVDFSIGSRDPWLGNSVKRPIWTSHNGREVAHDMYGHKAENTPPHYNVYIETENGTESHHYFYPSDHDWTKNY